MTDLCGRRIHGLNVRGDVAPFDRRSNSSDRPRQSNRNQLRTSSKLSCNPLRITLRIAQDLYFVQERPASASQRRLRTLITRIFAENGLLEPARQICCTINRFLTGFAAALKIDGRFSTFLVRDAFRISLHSVHFVNFQPVNHKMPRSSLFPCIKCLPGGSTGRLRLPFLCLDLDLFWPPSGLKKVPLNVPLRLQRDGVQLVGPQEVHDLAQAVDSLGEGRIGTRTAGHRGAD